MQEAEAAGRSAKLEWAAREGARVLSLQHAAKSVRLAHAATARAEASGATTPAPRNRKVRTYTEANTD
jgi:hypothetical protein